MVNNNFVKDSGNTAIKVLLSHTNTLLSHNYALLLNTTLSHNTWSHNNTLESHHTLQPHNTKINIRLFTFQRLKSKSMKRLTNNSQWIICHNTKPIVFFLGGGGGEQTLRIYSSGLSISSNLVNMRMILPEESIMHTSIFQTLKTVWLQTRGRRMNLMLVWCVTGCRSKALKTVLRTHQWFKSINIFDFVATETEVCKFRATCQSLETSGYPVVTQVQLHTHNTQTVATIVPESHLSSKQW